MDYVKNQVADCVSHNYKMEPGDGTMYRFGFQEFPKGLAYTMDSGVGYDGDEYVQFWINMPGGTGVTTVMKASLRHFIMDPQKHLIGYLQSHGMQHVHEYTLIACTLALAVLYENPRNLNEAALAMLETSNILAEWRA